MTSNGRAVVQRRDFMHASLHIDVETVDNIVLITRGPTYSGHIQADRGAGGGADGAGTGDGVFGRRPYQGREDPHRVLL